MKITRIKGSYSSTIRIYGCPPRLEEELRLLLTFHNPDYDMVKRFSPWENTKVVENVCLVEDFYDYIEFPRGFDATRLTVEGFRLWKLIRWEDDRVTFNVKFPKVRLTLNADQLHIERAFLRAEQSRQRPSGSYLFVVPTSAGKTIAQAALAGHTGQKTLVLCKTNLIRKAWQADLYKLYGMNEDDLGVIQQKKYRLGEHVTLASIATLARRKHLWHEIFSQVGCLIIDECQIIAARTIQEVMAACPARYIIGMTATETRRDKKTFLVTACMGPVITRIFNKQRETENSVPLADTRVVRTLFRYVNSKGQNVPPDMLDFHELTEQMVADKMRNSVIVEEVYRDWKAGHSVLVTTPRVAHAHALMEQLRQRGVKDASVLTGTTNSQNFYTDKLIENILSRKVRCTVATTQAIKLGANLNPLDRLHTAIPPSNKEDLEQLVGRIRRKDPSKKDAVLVYYHDINCQYWHSRFKRVFVPTMRKLRVPRWVNAFIA